MHLKIKQINPSFSSDANDQALLLTHLLCYSRYPIIDRENLLILAQKINIIIGQLTI